VKVTLEYLALNFAKSAKLGDRTGVPPPPPIYENNGLAGAIAPRSLSYKELDGKS